jgi:hypothetical protein
MADKVQYAGKTWHETHNGYYRHKALYLHRYVWEETNGAVPDGMAVTHADGDKSNNGLENLELKPRSAADLARRAAAARPEEPGVAFARLYADWLASCHKDEIGLPVVGQPFETSDGRLYVFEGARLRINRKGELFSFYAFRGHCVECGAPLSTWVATRPLDNSGLGRYCRLHSSRVWSEQTAAFEVAKAEGSGDLICKKLPEENPKPPLGEEDGSDLI